MNATGRGFHWNCASLTHRPLNLDATLASGQAFRWRKDQAGVWWGAVGDTIIAARQPGGPDTRLQWQTFPERDQWDVVADYFRLGVDLDALYAAWVKSLPQMAPCVEAYRGLRVLRQPPGECFFAFQCAACNTVVKIERTVRAFADTYGEALAAGSAAPFSFHAFPTCEVIAGAAEETLRAQLWGYRAPRIVRAARELCKLPQDWLWSLRSATYESARTELMQTFGIGPKIADCICLFALDKDDAVPVDTHVRQAAYELLMPELSGTSLTPAVYARVASAYRERFGGFAGWAQQYLFLTGLRSRKGGA